MSMTCCLLTINCSLITAFPMSTSTSLLLTPVTTSPLGRGLALAQVLKETLSALLLVLPTLLLRPWLVVAALPAVVLYGLHWALALSQLRRRAAALVWGVTLVEEVSTWLLREVMATSVGRVHAGRVVFMTGLVISLLALVELAWRARRRPPAAPRGVRHRSAGA